MRELVSTTGSWEIAIWIAEFVLRAEEENAAIEEAKQGQGEPESFR